MSPGFFAGAKWSSFGKTMVRDPGIVTASRPRAAAWRRGVFRVPYMIRVAAVTS